MECYQTVYRGGSGEITEKKSRFIADVFPVSDENGAMEKLEEVRKKYWDARHHCWAYVIGNNPPSERMSDDGEPAGTAGKPILEVVRGRGLTDVLVVVTRYFGGTLLGTGGLVRAYTSAAVQGISDAEIITKIHGFKQVIGTEYTGLGRIQHILMKNALPVLDTDYTEKVKLTVLVPDDGIRPLKKELMEASNGQVSIEEAGECWYAETGDGVRLFDK